MEALFSFKNVQEKMKESSKIGVKPGKGHLISKCPFGVIVLTKRQTIFLRISGIASKKRLSQKK